jgi:hypothetical protein
MGVIEVTQEMLAAKFGVIFPHLDEPADLIAFLTAEDAESATQTKPAC